jgi:hypothetical protein
MCSFLIYRSRSFQSTPKLHGDEEDEEDTYLEEDEEWV